jgi:hypothetical protein
MQSEFESQTAPKGELGSRIVVGEHNEAVVIWLTGSQAAVASEVRQAWAALGENTMMPASSFQELSPLQPRATAESTARQSTAGSAMLHRV